MWKYIGKIICGFLFVTLCTTAALAQSVVRGKIIDKKTKEPIQGASVSETDADERIVNGTSTDIEGNFVLKNVNPKNKLSITYIGYKTITQNINSRATINIALEEAMADIGEVAVVSRPTSGNGMVNIAERNLTTAVARINAKELEEMQAASIDQALQGRLSGVDITATSGDPGAAMNIRIRGISSISGSGNPLIVVDGMPLQTEIPGDFNFGSADEQGYAQLLNISPADIKEITALKDASATAIWGSRAANGVLVITTKRGGKGTPAITYTAKTTASFLPKAIPLLNGDQY